MGKLCLRIALSLSLSFWSLSATAADINLGANKGKQSQKNGQKENDSTGSALIAAGMALMMSPPTIPAGIALMMMGMTAKKQAAHDGDASFQSGNTANASFSGGAGGANGLDGTGNGSAAMGNKNGDSIFKDKDVKNAIAAIEGAGGSVDKNGVIMPDGTKKPWSAFQSAKALEKNGFDAKSIMATVADVEKKVAAGAGSGMSVASVATAGGAGGAGAGGAGNGIGMPEDADGAGGAGSGARGNPFAISAEARARLIAGKTMRVAGEPVGASGDNIFQMVHRVYVRKTKDKQFILEENIAANFGPRNR